MFKFLCVEILCKNHRQKRKVSDGTDTNQQDAANTCDIMNKVCWELTQHNQVFQFFQYESISEGTPFTKFFC